MLKIYEDFYSIQGEGNFQGYPAIFVRVAGCNLRCPGFACEYNFEGVKRIGCDTWYAVDPDIYKGKTLNLASREDVESYLKKLLFFVVGNKPIIVITGGEPLLYKDNPEFEFLVENLIMRGYVVNIETNGTIEPAGWMDNINWSVSIKLNSSGNDYHDSIIPEVIKTFAGLKNTIFKFVVGGKEDVEEIMGIILLNKIPLEKVWLMPMGETKDKVLEKTNFVMEICAKYGFKYSSRLHLLGNIK